MLINVTINSKLQKIMDRLSPETFAAARRAGLILVVEKVEGKAAENAPIVTSNLVNSRTSDVSPDGTKGWIRFTSKYAKYVHEGTGLFGPHKQEFTILPKNKKALAWPGGTHPVKKVIHKGQHPNPFLRKAGQQINVRSIFGEGVMNYLRRAGL